MPRVKSWVERIPLILQHLETDAKAVYTRAEVEVLFIIGRSQATNLMKIAGAQVRNGAEAAVGRDSLRYYVERCPEAAAFLAEQERKKKLAKRLHQTAEELRLKDVKIPGVKPRDEWTRWRDLPNVSITPGTIQIVFADEADLLHTLMQMLKAVANEPDVFALMCGGAEMQNGPRRCYTEGGR